MQFFDFAFDHLKGTVKRRHKRPAHDLDQPDFLAHVRPLNDERPLPGRAVGIIGRAQDSGLFANIIHHFLFIPDVIARRECRKPQVK